MSPSVAAILHILPENRSCSTRNERCFTQLTRDRALLWPVATHPNGLPIGIQLGTRATGEHVVLQLAAALEEALPWAVCVPALHVSTHERAG